MTYPYLGRLAGLEPASHGLPRSQIVRGGCADRWHITPHSRLFFVGDISRWCSAATERCIESHTCYTLTTAP